MAGYVLLLLVMCLCASALCVVAALGLAALIVSFFYVECVKLLREAR